MPVISGIVPAQSSGRALRRARGRSRDGRPHARGHRAAPPDGRPAGGRPGGARSRWRPGALQAYDRAAEHARLPGPLVERARALAVSERGRRRRMSTGPSSGSGSRACSTTPRSRARSPARKVRRRKAVAASRPAGSGAEGGVSRPSRTRRSTPCSRRKAVDQRAIVEEAARKKLRSLAGLDPAVQRRRLYGFLARRGYEVDDIRGVLSAIGSSLGAEAARTTERRSTTPRATRLAQRSSPCRSGWASMIGHPASQRVHEPEPLRRAHLIQTRGRAPRSLRARVAPLEACRPAARNRRAA